jgi:hypothetical protein
MSPKEAFIAILELAAIITWKVVEQARAAVFRKAEY